MPPFYAFILHVYKYIFLFCTFLIPTTVIRMPVWLVKSSSVLQLIFPFRGLPNLFFLIGPEKVSVDMVFQLKICVVQSLITG